MWDLIIVGAGPAGLSAAIYGVRSGKKVLVLEKSSYGGQIINTPQVDNYPGISHISGYEFATNLYNQALELGTQVQMESVSEIVQEDGYFQVSTSGGCYQGKSVVLAVGARNRLLGLPKEEQLIGRGVSYCATCDGAFFRGRPVAVVGGGNTALEDATFLSNYCSSVYLIHRRDQFRGEIKLEETLRKRDNVNFLLNTTVVGLKGNEVLNGILIENVNTKERQTIEVEGLFVAIGQEPMGKEFAPLIDVNEAGYIIGQEDCFTSQAGIFVAGDCRTKKVRQLTTATSDGAVAALAACEYLNH